jgi:hypothetical protein
MEVLKERVTDKKEHKTAFFAPIYCPLIQYHYFLEIVAKSGILRSDCFDVLP